MYLPIRKFVFVVIFLIPVTALSQSICDIKSKISPYSTLDTIKVNGQSKELKLSSHYVKGLVSFRGDAVNVSKLSEVTRKDTSDIKYTIDIFNTVFEISLIISGYLNSQTTFFMQYLELRYGLAVGAAIFENHIIINDINSRDANFANTNFNKGLSILNSCFVESIKFENINLGDSIVSFNGSNFNSGIIFDRVQLPDYLDFSNVKSDSTIDLSGSTLPLKRSKEKDYCSINLFDAPLGQFKFSYENFKLFIPPSTDIATFEKSNSLFEQLLKKFKDNGQLSSYEKLDKDYQEFKFTNDPRDNFKFTGQFLNFINRKWNDYGYAKDRIWRHTFILFLIFTLINRLRLEHLNSAVYPIAAINKEVTRGRYKKRSKIKKALDIRLFYQAIFYTALVFFGLKISIENLKFNSSRGVFYILLQYVIGLVCVAYLANFVISSQVIGS